MEEKNDLENEFLNRKKEMLDKFEAFVYSLIIQNDPTFSFQFSIMNKMNTNGTLRKTRYKDLEINDRYVLEIFSFDYKPQSSTLENYSRTIHVATKLETNYANNLKREENSRLIKDNNPSQSLDNVPRVVKNKVNEFMKEKCLEIIKDIFSGKRQDLIETYPECKQLIIENRMLNEEIKQSLSNNDSKKR